MQLNDLQSIILKDYIDTLNKAIIHKTIDKIATLVADEMSISIYYELLNQQSSHKQSLNQAVIKSSKDNSKDNSKNNNSDIIDKTKYIDRTKQIDKHNYDKIKFCSKCFNTDDKNNNQDNLSTENNLTTKNNSSSKDSTSIKDELSSKDNISVKNDLSNKNDTSTKDDLSSKDNINNADMIFNKLIDILEAGYKTNNKTHEILSEDEVNKLLKAAFSLSEIDPFHHDDIFKAFFNNLRIK